MSRDASAADASQGAFVLGAEPEAATAAQRVLLEAVIRAGYDQAACFAIRLAVEEALSNAFHHGNRGDPARTVSLHYAVDRDGVVIDVADQGQGFDPGTVPDPTEPENVEIPSGRGIVLMRAYMTSVEYLPPGNRVRMVYRKPGA